MLYQPVRPFSVTRSAGHFWRIIGVHLGAIGLRRGDLRRLESLLPGELEDLGLRRSYRGGIRRLDF